MVHYSNAAEQRHVPTEPTPVSLHKGRGMIIPTPESVSNACKSFSHSVKYISAEEVKWSIWKIPSGFYDKRKTKRTFLKKKKKTKSNVFIVQYTAVLEFPLRVS